LRKAKNNVQNKNRSSAAVKLLGMACIILIHEYPKKHLILNIPNQIIIIQPNHTHTLSESIKHLSKHP
jgi:hypothetical protein